MINRHLYCTGDISIRTSLKADVADVYTLQLEVYDSGQPALNDITNITITVLRSPPCIIDSNNGCSDWQDTATIAENHLGGTSFYSVRYISTTQSHSTNRYVWNVCLIAL